MLSRKEKSTSRYFHRRHLRAFRQTPDGWPLLPPSCLVPEACGHAIYECRTFTHRHDWFCMMAVIWLRKQNSPWSLPLMRCIPWRIYSQSISVREDKVSPANTSVRLVLETLTPLPGDRKCFRMINGVLVERTVSEVLPALQTNAEGLKKVLEDLVKQYRTKQEDMDKWKVRMPLVSLYYRSGFWQPHRKRTIYRSSNSKISYEVLISLSQGRP